MNKKEFRIWLVMNDYNLVSLSEKLGITTRTIQKYMSNDRFPPVFEYALHGLTLIKLTKAQYDAIKHLLTVSQKSRIEIIEE